MAKQSAITFYQLSTDHVLDAVEKALNRTESGRRATGSVLALNSLENRVYQIEFEDGVKVVTKFYRPNRWNLSQLEEEHLFLKKLLAAEVPVVAPLSLPNAKGSTIATSSEGIHFAVFPMVKGRLLDELTPTHLQILGRYVGRIHRIGATFQKTLRHRLDVETFGWNALDYLLESNFFETDAVAEQYEDTVVGLLNRIEPMFTGKKYILVHGDCHLGNTLWNGEQPFFLDFDDLCMAPAVQDIWMIVRGRDLSADKDREILISSYEQMNEFDPQELSLIEPLRALRIIHYSSWIAKRWDDPSFPRAFPDFGTTRYWHEEISEL
ncbi:MAG: Stress response kinase, partial [Bacteriovoracaceae bacterium]|nr:Stress response kinase [Bacteriovoracaceae bacterium]